MARPEKVAVVDEIRTKLDESDAAVLTEYRGLTVHELAELRASLRPTGTQYKVFKNTPGPPGRSRAAVSTRSPTSSRARWRSRSCSGDAAAAAKALREFGKSHDALVLKGGLLGERVITPNEIEALADLPSREVLLTQIAGVFQAPLTRAAGLFQAFTRNFAYGVQGADRPACRRRRSRARRRGAGRGCARRRRGRSGRASDDAPAADAPADDAARGGGRGRARRGRRAGEPESTESE